MKKKAIAGLVGTLLGAARVAAPAHAQNVKIGLMSAISGPIAALAPPMAAASRLAVTHVNEQGGILNGGKLEVVLGDSACNPQNATDVATKAVNIDRVIAVVGPACSGAVLASANSVTIPAGVLMITPSGTSPEIAKLKDKDLVFRTLPSDDYQGRALARTLKARGIDKVAVAYLSTTTTARAWPNPSRPSSKPMAAPSPATPATRRARLPTAPSWLRSPAVAPTRSSSSTTAMAPASPCCARRSRTISSRPSSAPTA